MFSNSRKTIGFFVESVRGEFSASLVHGVEKEAKRLGYNLAIFSPFGNYGRNERHFVGDNKLYSMPCYEEFDGVIVALDTLQNKESRELVLSNIEKFCNCPIVSIRVEHEGMSNLLVDNAVSMDSMIRHHIVDHGFKRIVFMSGPEGREDSELRAGCFKKLMKEHNLPIMKNGIYYGDFWFNKAKEACDFFLANDEMPESIVCANDYMAVSVTSELIGRGIRVPEQIAVTGYDGMPECVHFSPSISTVTVPFNEMGIRAVDIIDEKQANPSDTVVEYFDPLLELRESCGCVKSDDKDVVLERRNQYEAMKGGDHLNTQFDYMSIGLEECQTIEDIADVVGRYIYNFLGVKNYCVCLNERLEEQTRFDSYTDDMEVRIGLKNGEKYKDGRVLFPRCDLIPSVFTDDSPQIWYFTPLHHQDKTFGYEAIQYNEGYETNKLSFRWTIIVGNQIASCLQKMETSRLIEKLEDLYDKDSLTGMYSRRGFTSHGNQAFEEALASKKGLFVAIIDLDDMKYINDNFGHVEGDFALIKIAAALNKCFVGENIHARTGGDEFVIIAYGEEESVYAQWMKDIISFLDEFNSTKEKGYSIYASYGYAYHVPCEGETIEDFVREGDEKMYVNKVVNKKTRGLSNLKNA